jgi:hypothetical protein
MIPCRVVTGEEITNSALSGIALSSAIQGVWRDAWPGRWYSPGFAGPDPGVMAVGAEDGAACGPPRADRVPTIAV